MCEDARRYMLNHLTATRLLVRWMGGGEGNTASVPKASRMKSRLKRPKKGSPAGTKLHSGGRIPYNQYIIKERCTERDLAEGEHWDWQQDPPGVSWDCRRHRILSYLYHASIFPAHQSDGSYWCLMSIMLRDCRLLCRTHTEVSAALCMFDFHHILFFGALYSFIKSQFWIMVSLFRYDWLTDYSDWLTNHTNQIFSESFKWHTLSTHPPTTHPSLFHTHQTHTKPDFLSTIEH